MEEPIMRNIILGISGSISAYKSADITNRLIDKNYNVNVVMTKAGTAFITPLTMQALSKNLVYTDVLQESNPAEIVHISLPQKADCILIAPATANFIGKIASGIADDMLSSLILASKSIPKLIAPAMNYLMYENVAVQSNLKILQQRGWIIIEPREARLACGTYGKGALANVDDIVNTVVSIVGED
jgi:phosphopantothenoylcysteine decarboxylase